jgi:siroheme synthase (precorrin-2 oxidase/ferrochelatase)
VREFKVATNASEKVTFVAPEFNSEEEFEKLADERDRDRIGQDNARRVEEEANR